MPLGQRILVIVSERIGDAIFCTLAIAQLRQYRPAAQLDLLALSSSAASVFAHNPALNTVHTLSTQKQLPTLGKYYDCVIDLHNSKLSRRYCALLNLPIYVNARHQVGEHQSSVASLFISKLLQCAIPEPTPYLLYPQSQHFQAIQGLLAKAQVDLSRDILIGCHMGCSQITRRRFKFWKKTIGHKSWPLTNFKQLALALQKNFPTSRLVLTGTHNEKFLCQAITKLSKQAIDLVGQTSVLELAALFKMCAVIITGDTGALHVACTSSRPIVALFGPTASAETGPYPPQQSHHIIIQADTIENITVETVYTAIARALSLAKPVKLA